MIADRTESPLAGEARENLARSDDARALWRRLFVTPANLRPDYAAGTPPSNFTGLRQCVAGRHDRDLYATLTATETCCPTTCLCLIYRQVGSP
jgi:hypothetical protein